MNEEIMDVMQANVPVENVEANVIPEEIPTNDVGPIIKKVAKSGLIVAVVVGGATAVVKGIRWLVKKTLTDDEVAELAEKRGFECAKPEPVEDEPVEACADDESDGYDED